MRYGIALLIAAVVIAAVGLFIWQARREVDTRIRQALRQEQEAGRAPPAWQNVDADTVELHDFNVMLPARLQFRLDLARLLSSTWYLRAPAAVALCLAGAAAVGWLRHPR